MGSRLINSFGFIADLYRFNPYGSASTEWSTYPWQIGLDNPISIDGNLSEIKSSKMIWSVSNDNNIAFTGNILSMVFDFSLYKIDNYGGIGDQSGQNPNFSPENNIADLLSSYGDLTSIVMNPVLIELNSNSENYPDDSVVSAYGDILQLTMNEVLVIKNSYSDDITHNSATTSAGEITAITMSLI